MNRRIQTSLHLLRVLFGREALVEATSDEPFVEQLPHERGFAEFHRKVIRPLVRSCEHERITALTKIRLSFRRVLPWAVLWVALWVGVHVAGALGVAPFDAISQTLGWFLTLVILGATLAFPVGFALVPLLDYQYSLKEKVLPELVTFFGSDWTYQYFGDADYRPNRVRGKHKKRLTKERFEKSAIAPEFTVFFIKDYLTGTVREQTIELGTVTLGVVRREDSRNQLTIRFNGLGGAYPLAPPMKGRTVVRVGPERGTSSNSAKALRDTSVVRFDQPEFDDLVEVRSSHPEEARELIQPQYRAAIVDFVDYLLTHELARGFRLELSKGLMLLMIPATYGPFFRFGNPTEPALGVDDLRTFLMHANILNEMSTLIPRRESRSQPQVR
jgi:hypothetical protein